VDKKLIWVKNFGKRALPEKQVNQSAKKGQVDYFYIIKAIVCVNVKVSRMAHRAQNSYWGMLLDDSDRKPV
jgi:hypothetical protein